MAHSGTFRVGDWVQIVGRTFMHDNERGRIIWINSVNDWHRVEFVPGAFRRREDRDWDEYFVENLRRITPTEEEEVEWMCALLSR